MTERSCTTCEFESVPKTTVVCKVCLEPERVALPNYKAKAGIPTTEQKQEVMFDESRADSIGQNGNEGLHYDGIEDKRCTDCVHPYPHEVNPPCFACIRGGKKEYFVPKEKPAPIMVELSPVEDYDNVQKPKHYQLLPGVEVIDVRRALLAKVDGMDNPPSAFAVNCWDRALEYTIRAWEKNGVEDLEKAVTYLQWCIGELKG